MDTSYRIPDASLRLPDAGYRHLESDIPNFKTKKENKWL